MTQPPWQALELIKNKVPAKPDGLWTIVYWYLEGPMKLKLQATGQWEYSPAKKCSPDGGRSAGLLQDSLVLSAPVGALIGKIGGSTADKPDPTKQLVFTVGSTCVILLDDKTKGALFLTMNDQVSRFDDHSGEISVEAWEAR